MTASFWWDLLIGTAAALVLVWAGLVVVLLIVRPRGGLLREALRLLPDVLRLARRLAGDKTLPRGVRIRLGLLLAYLASPIDVIPDFVPVLGYADDAIIATAVLRGVVRRAGLDAVRAHWPGTDDGFAAVARIAGGGSLSRVEVDPRVLGPGLAPTPFTAEEIRAGCPVGRTIRLLVEEDGAEPYERVNRFVACDETGAVIERVTPTGTVTDRATWADLQAHAAFPLAGTTVERETIDLPIGSVDCLRYTVRDRDDENVFWFSPAHPGMPVRVRRVTGGRTVATTTMIASS